MIKIKNEVINVVIDHICEVHGFNRSGDNKEASTIWRSTSLGGFHRHDEVTFYTSGVTVIVFYRLLTLNNNFSGRSIPNRNADFTVSLTNPDSIDTIISKLDELIHKPI